MNQSAHSLTLVVFRRILSTASIAFRFPRSPSKVPTHRLNAHKREQRRSARSRTRIQVEARQEKMGGSPHSGWALLAGALHVVAHFTESLPRHMASSTVNVLAFVLPCRGFAYDPALDEGGQKGPIELNASLLAILELEGCGASRFLNALRMEPMVQPAHQGAMGCGTSKVSPPRIDSLLPGRE